MREEGYYWIKMTKKQIEKGFREWEIGYHFGTDCDVFTCLDFEFELGVEIEEIDERRIEMENECNINTGFDVTVVAEVGEMKVIKSFKNYSDYIDYLERTGEIELEDIMREVSDVRQGC